MVRKDDIERSLNSHLTRLLLVAEVALPPNQFKAFRKVALDEFGNNGFGKDLERLFSNNTARHGTGRNRSGKEGGAS